MYYMNMYVIKRMVTHGCDLGGLHVVSLNTDNFCSYNGLKSWNLISNKLAAIIIVLHFLNLIIPLLVRRYLWLHTLKHMSKLDLYPLPFYLQSVSVVRQTAKETQPSAIVSPYRRQRARTGRAVRKWNLRKYSHSYSHNHCSSAVAD